MPVTASLPFAGLFARTDREAPVPLLGVAVEVDITGLCARVSVAHRYVNREATPIEAVYVFPLDEGAAVCGFEAVINGLVVFGEAQEREQAFERYDDAMARGDGAFLLDEHRPDVLQASIGNLPPGQELAGPRARHARAGALIALSSTEDDDRGHPAVPRAPAPISTADVAA